MWGKVAGFVASVIIAWLVADVVIHRPPLITGKREFCWDDITVEPIRRQCQLSCPQGFFSLPGMLECQPWLQCHDILNVVVKVKVIGQGAVKQISLCEWGSYKITMNEPITDKYIEDFRHGFEVLKILQGHAKVTQILGVCGDIYLTQYYPLQSAENLMNILTNISKVEDILARFGLCLDYVEILKFLHDHNDGGLVMCDSSDLNKTLQQYLVRENLTLVLNDVDSVARILKNGLVKCGHRELSGDFVAPEQLWPYTDEEFSDSRMPGYNEKVDIWKIPDVCNFFLGLNSDSVKLKLLLLNIHAACKFEQPNDRPTAGEILQEYRRIWKTFTINSEMQTKMFSM